VVLASQLLLDECVSAKQLGVCVGYDGANDPPQIRAPLTDRQKIVNECDSRLAQHFALFWELVRGYVWAI